ncbi:hypothetical protein [Limimaricola soesokkakensis]|uniref:hypothetical protein n=1 Tax=Limimaricola soesokkakensis TaxID=1343159 RepID=UPI000A2686BE|nr:hypothetical protein [Limimaricola soesokkakensis]
MVTFISPAFVGPNQRIQNDHVPKPSDQDQSRHALIDIGENRASAEALLHALPESVIARVTGHKLAELLDAMWKLSQNSRASVETEVVSDDSS